MSPMYNKSLWKSVCTKSFCMVLKNGRTRYGCNLKTTASIFETGLRCESYNPNMHDTW